MRTRSRLFLRAVAMILCAALGYADGLPAPTTDPRWAALNSALASAKEQRHDLSLVKAELRKLFLSPSQDAKELGIRWLGHARPHLSSSERDELQTLFIELNPDTTQSYGLRVEMAVRHLEEKPIDERRSIYHAAVKNGYVTLESVEVLRRPAALGRAALEGIEEFAPLIETYAGEINQSAPRHGYRRSDELLWYMRLRAGAENREDALRLHVRRLGEMNDEHFAELMNDDRAFRVATQTVLDQACGNSLAEPCLDFARITMRQDHERKRRIDKDGDTRPPDKTDWLEGFRSATAAARVRISQRTNPPGRPNS